MKDNSNLIICAVLIYTLWLIGLTWGILNLDHKVNPPIEIGKVNNDTIYIHDTIYIDNEERK